MKYVFTLILLLIENVILGIRSGPNIDTGTMVDHQPYGRHIVHELTPSVVGRFGYFKACSEVGVRTQVLKRLYQRVLANVVFLRMDLNIVQAIFELPSILAIIAREVFMSVDNEPRLSNPP